ncbi:MAG: response regulator [Desulfomonile tiedjei]|nr:response regulator [Desulfomonile tiedjei]
MEDWKVLLVDDEEDFVSTLAERLNLRGIPTSIATTGEDALRLVAADAPQIVVLDVMMPGMSGLEVLQRLRADFPQIPVLLLSGIGSTQDTELGMRLGAVDFLMKPLQIEQLIGKMSAAVTKAPGGVRE